MVLQGITDIFPSLPEKIKDSVSIKKALQGYVYWAEEKEILGWILNYEAGNFQLPPRRIADLKALLAITSTRRRIAPPKLCSLIGKPRSMQLKVPSTIRHF